MVTFGGLQHTSLTGGTLYSQGLVLHQCIFLRSSENSTLPTLCGCVNCLRASFSPAVPTATNGLASRRSNASVPPAGSSRYQHHSWLKYLRVVGVNPLPALPLPFSLKKPPRLAARSTGSPPGSVPLMHRFTGTGEKVPFLFSLPSFYCLCSISDLLLTGRYKIPLYTISWTLPGLLDSRIPSHYSFCQ